MKVRLEIIKCHDCGRLCFALGGKKEDEGGCRLSHHKCSGRWETVLSEVHNLETIADEAWDA